MDRYWANVDLDGEWDGDRPPGWASRVLIPEHHMPSPSGGTGWEQRFPDIGHAGFYDPEPRPGYQEDFRSTFDARFTPLSPERQREALERAALEHDTRLKDAAARKSKPSNTYLIGAEGSPLVKIGFTSGKPKSRMSSLQTGTPMKLSLLWSTEGDYEGRLHERFHAYRVIGEWFDLTPLGDPVEIISGAVEELQSADAEKE